jgi:hypothetical protein
MELSKPRCGGGAAGCIGCCHHHGKNGTSSVAMWSIFFPTPTAHCPTQYSNDDDDVLHVGSTVVFIIAKGEETSISGWEFDGRTDATLVFNDWPLLLANSHLRLETFLIASSVTY